MEQRLFTWKSIGELDYLYVQFYNVKLLRNIKQFKKGSKFPSATIDFENGSLTFFNMDDKILLQVDLELKIVE